MKQLNMQLVVFFQPKTNLRRFTNEIEDALGENYFPPQTIPIPDEIPPEAPRIILTPKNQLSQIAISNNSISFSKGYLDADHETPKNIDTEIELLSKILSIIKVDKFNYCGIIKNFLEETDKPQKQIQKKLLSESLQHINLESNITIQITQVLDTYYINKQIQACYEQTKAIQNQKTGIIYTIDVNNKKSANTTEADIGSIKAKLKQIESIISSNVNDDIAECFTLHQ